MPLVNALPFNVYPGQPWSSTAPQQALELITTYNLEEQFALTTDPGDDIAWADIGTLTSVGSGIIKVASAMPSTTAMIPFAYGGNRKYNTMDAVATTIGINPFELSYGIPMVWNQLGNGWELKSSENGALIDFVGISGLAQKYVISGKHAKAQLAASLFYESLYCTSLGLTSPKARTFAQPLNPSGIALFTDGTGAENSGGALHFSNPTVATSGRFKNVYPAFGTFANMFGASLTKMTLKPNATLPNVTSGAYVTDVFGPSHMRDRFYRMMVQTLSPELFASAPALAAAATTNPYQALAGMGINEETFLGKKIGRHRYHILPQLDNHPYVLAHLTDGPGGEQADFWINVCAAPGRASWAKLGCNSKDFTPVFRMYGPGDPLAMSQRMMRWEGDLDGGCAAGDPIEVDMFMGV